MLRFNLSQSGDEPAVRQAVFVALARLRREIGETRRELDRLEDDLARALDEILDGNGQESS